MFASTLTYLWVMLILFGSITFETFVIYPNIFHDPPRSLVTALEFMTVRGPSDFFPPLGFLSWVTGAAALALCWPVRSARYWLLAAVLMVLCEGLFSVAFFWPRNTIMFVEGPAVHSAAVLEKTAQEFQRLHWSRITFNAVGAASAFIGFLHLYRDRVTRHVESARIPVPS